MNRILLSFAAAGLLAAPLLAQVPPGEVRAPAPSDELQVTTYSPTAFPAVTLLDVANRLFGDQITIAVPARATDRNRSGFATSTHFVLLGQLLVIRDTPEYTKKIVDVLHTLEAEETKRRRDVEDESHRRAAAMTARDGGAEPDDSVATQSTELRPRNVSFETLVAALKPLTRQVEFVPQGGAGWPTMNVNPIPDGNVIVVYETVKRLAQLKELVERIDRPRPQVAITVLLVRANESKGLATNEEAPNAPKKEKGVPAELARSLKEMLPGQSFELLSTGMLRCSAQTMQQCQLRMNLADGGNWSLTFVPEAYDVEASELSLSHCQFHCELPLAGQHPAKQDFDTSLTVKTGEYVAIGAVGAQPTFVVLRAEPIRRPQ